MISSMNWGDQNQTCPLCNKNECVRKLCMPCSKWILVAADDTPLLGPIHLKYNNKLSLQIIFNFAATLTLHLHISTQHSALWAKHVGGGPICMYPWQLKFFSRTSYIYIGIRLILWWFPFLGISFLVVAKCVCSTIEIYIIFMPSHIFNM